MVEASSDSGTNDATDSRYAGFARATAGIEVKVDGKAFVNTVLKVRLIQCVNDHDRLEATIVGDMEDQHGVDGLKSGHAANMLGKSLTLTVWDLLNDPDGKSALSWTGPVTDVSFENTSDGQAEIVLTAASPTVALDSGKRNAVFIDQSAHDIVSSVIGKYSVPVGKKDVQSSTFKYVTQYRETDYDFVQRMAAAGGACVFYDGSKLQVAKPGGSAAATLTWGVDLGSFKANVGSRPVQFTTVSRDYVKDDKVISKAYKKPSFTGQYDQKSGSASDEMYAEPGFIDAAGEIDMAGLDKMLNHATAAAYAGALRCTGQSLTHKVTAGIPIDVTKITSQSGSFWVEKVEHVIEDGLYHNTFEGVSVGAAVPQPRRERPKMTDLQTAHVVDLDDPDKLGRIKIAFNWLDADFNFWVRCASPHAGKGHGWYSRPEIGDEVIVAFEQGNPDRPIVLGSLYNGKQKPAQDDTSDNNLKWFLTKSGHKVEFDDKDEKITIVSAKETCTILLDGKNKSISITASGDMSIEGDNVTIKAKQKLQLESGTDAQLKAGAGLKVEAGANLDAKASAMMNLKGAMINLN